MGQRRPANVCRNGSAITGHRRDPVADQLDALAVDGAAAQLRHRDRRVGVLHAKQEYRIVRPAGIIGCRPGELQLSVAAIADRRSLALAGLCAAGCVVLVAALLLDQRVIAAGAKLVASSAFVSLAVCAGAFASRYGAMILAGLVLSWFGDAFLVGTSQHWFLLGLASFLLAHVAYLAAFVTAGIERRWILVAVLPVAVIAAGVLAWLQPQLPPALVWPVRLYTAVISLMVVAAFGTAGTGATRLIVVGACLFYVSDLSVAALRFTEPPFPTYVLGLPLYYAAQLCLALSVAASNNRDPSTARRQNTPPGNR
jgi:uncharacterized membrane protein YhhN